MSILIKGMEMPKDGFITVTITSDGRVVGNYKRERDKFEYLDNKDIATAVPVPPHGGLIDRDALMKILSKVIDINASIEQRNEATDQERRCLWWFEQQIGIAPTIIPAEEGEK